MTEIVVVTSGKGGSKTPQLELLVRSRAAVPRPAVIRFASACAPRPIIGCDRRVVYYLIKCHKEALNRRSSRQQCDTCSGRAASQRARRTALTQKASSGAEELARWS